MFVSLEMKHRQSFSVSNELSGVSFADEDFQQPQFGFDMLVFVVLRCQRRAVLLLHIPVEARQQILNK